MPTPGIVERTDEEIVVINSSKVFIPVSRSLNVPDALAGKYVTAVAVVTNVALDDAQEATLQTEIEAIVGVALAKILVGSSRLSLDRMPIDTLDVDYQFHVGIQMGFDVVPIDIV